MLKTAAGIRTHKDIMRLRIISASPPPTSGGLFEIMDKSRFRPLRKAYKIQSGYSRKTPIPNYQITSLSKKAQLAQRLGALRVDLEPRRRHRPTEGPLTTHCGHLDGPLPEGFAPPSCW